MIWKSLTLFFILTFTVGCHCQGQRISKENSDAHSNQKSARQLREELESIANKLNEAEEIIDQVNADQELIKSSIRTLQSRKEELEKEIQELPKNKVR